MARRRRLVDGDVHTILVEPQTIPPLVLPSFEPTNARIGNYLLGPGLTKEVIIASKSDQTFTVQNAITKEMCELKVFTQLVLPNHSLCRPSTMNSIRN